MILICISKKKCIIILVKLLNEGNGDIVYIGMQED